MIEAATGAADVSVAVDALLVVQAVQDRRAFAPLCGGSSSGPSKTKPAGSKRSTLSRLAERPVSGNAVPPPGRERRIRREGRRASRLRASAATESTGRQFRFDQVEHAVDIERLGEERRVSDQHLAGNRAHQDHRD